MSNGGTYGLRGSKQEVFVSTIQQDLTRHTKHNKLSVEKLALSFGITDKTLVKELTELAIVNIARAFAHQPVSIKERFDNIVELYNGQVNLSHRTSQSMLLQQYSTPAPIGYLASAFVIANSTLNGGYKLFGKIVMSDAAFKRKYGVNKAEPKGNAHLTNNFRPALYFEPSAGNGLLTIAGNPEHFIVNEIDTVRNNNLKTQGYREVTKTDATLPFPYVKKFDGVITNPPFGSLDKAIDFNGFPISVLDHLMCIRALDTMKDTGRAALIIGGHTAWDKEGRIQAGKNRIFFAYLYKHYNVLDVINIDGHKLYSRQGTAFNVRLILIDGRKAVPNGFPTLYNPEHDKVVYTFDELFDRVTLFNIQETEDKHPEKTDEELEAEVLRLKLELMNF